MKRCPSMEASPLSLLGVLNSKLSPLYIWQHLDFYEIIWDAKTHLHGQTCEGRLNRRIIVFLRVLLLEGLLIFDM